MEFVWGSWSSVYTIFQRPLYWHTNLEKRNLITSLLFQKRKPRNSLEELLKIIEKSFFCVILGLRAEI